MRFLLKLDQGLNDKQIKDVLGPILEREMGTEIVLKNGGMYRGFWVYYYQSKSYLTTHDDLEKLYGNAPIVIYATTFDAYVTGTAKQVRDYIDEFLD